MNPLIILGVEPFLTRMPAHYDSNLAQQHYLIDKK